MTPDGERALAKRIAKEEGENRLPNGNHGLYKDTKNIWTIGHGYNIQEHGLPDDIVADLDRRALKAADDDAKKVPGYFAANDARQSVVAAMVYQMGLHSVLGFKDFCAHMAASAYNAAADAMLDSEWYRRDSPARAKRESDIMRSGVMPS